MQVLVNGSRIRGKPNRTTRRPAGSEQGWKSPLVEKAGLGSGGTDPITILLQLNVGGSYIVGDEVD